MQTFDDPRITAMGLLIEVHDGLAARLKPDLIRRGLSEVNFAVLLRLGRSPGHRLRMSDLAAQANLSTSGITRVIDRLEREGLVRRVACAEDRRTMYAQLTESGVERLGEVLPSHVAEIERWFTGLLTPAQLDALLAALRIVRDAVRPCATAGSEDRLQTSP